MTVRPAVGTSPSTESAPTAGTAHPALLLFDLDRPSGLGQAVASALGTPLAAHEARPFGDGEAKHRPLVDPAGRDAFVIGSLHGDADASPQDKLVRLLMFAATLRDHGAARVTAVLPYLAYARKDRRTQPFDPLSLRYVAQWIESVGIDQVVAFEVHNVVAFENAFRCVTRHLPAWPALAGLLAPAAPGPMVVASPDPGGVKRAQLWREALQARWDMPVGFALCDKRRSGGVLSGGDLVAGEVQGATVVLVDDMVVSGQTLQRAAQALRQAGARHVVACAAHGLMSADAVEVLADGAIAELLLCDTVPLPHAIVRALGGKLRMAGSASLFADTIAQSHARWCGR